jgi:hypothetical protein
MLVMIFLAAPAQAAIELVVNGDFETGDFTGWTTTPAASGSLISVQDAGVASQVAAFQATDFLHDSISQLVPTTPGAEYTLSFALANLREVVNDSFQVLWDGVLVFDETPVVSVAPAFPLSFTQFTFDVLASGAATPLEFRGYDVPSTLALDNVSVMAATNRAVPEAASLAVWSGLGLLVGAVACSRRWLGAAEPQR